MTGAMSIEMSLMCRQVSTPKKPAMPNVRTERALSSARRIGSLRTSMQLTTPMAGSDAVAGLGSLMSGVSHSSNVASRASCQTSAPSNLAAWKLPGSSE